MKSQATSYLQQDIETSTKGIFHHFHWVVYNIDIDSTHTHTHTHSRKEREPTVELSKRRGWNGAKCVDEAENWLLETTRFTYPTPKQINSELQNEKLLRMGHRSMLRSQSIHLHVRLDAIPEPRAHWGCAEDYEHAGNVYTQWDSFLDA